MISIRKTWRQWHAPWASFSERAQHYSEQGWHCGTCRDKLEWTMLCSFYANTVKHPGLCMLDNKTLWHFDFLLAIIRQWKFWFVSAAEKSPAIISWRNTSPEFNISNRSTLLIQRRLEVVCTVKEKNQRIFSESSMTWQWRGKTPRREETSNRHRLWRAAICFDWLGWRGHTKDGTIEAKIDSTSQRPEWVPSIYKAACIIYIYTLYTYGWIYGEIHRYRYRCSWTNLPGSGLKLGLCRTNLPGITRTKLVITVTARQDTGEKKKVP